MTTADIDGFSLQSFQTYGTALQKQCKMIRYHLQSDGSPAVFGNVNVDYNLADESAQLNFSTSIYGCVGHRFMGFCYLGFRTCA
jgi:hypothetical protein